MLWFHVGEGAEKSTLSSVDCRSGLRKIIWRKEGSFGCLSKIVSKKTVPIRRSLRKIVTSSPPSPLKNPNKSQGGYAPPPLIVWWWLSTLVILSMFVDHSFEIYCFNSFVTNKLFVLSLGSRWKIAPLLLQVRIFLQISNLGRRSCCPVLTLGSLLVLILVFHLFSYLNFSSLNQHWCISDYYNINSLQWDVYFSGCSSRFEMYCWPMSSLLFFLVKMSSLLFDY